MGISGIEKPEIQQRKWELIFAHKKPLLGGKKYHHPIDIRPFFWAWNSCISFITIVGAHLEPRRERFQDSGHFRHEVSEHPTPS